MLTHVTNTLRLIEAGTPVDLLFQSIAGTEKANLSFGVTPELLDEADLYLHPEWQRTFLHEFLSHLGYLEQS